MTKKELDKGIKISEFDRYDNGIYLGTDTLYLLNNQIYEHTYNDNHNTYTGREYEIFNYGSRESFFNQYSNWFKHDLEPAAREVLKQSEIECFDRYEEIWY